MSLGLALHDTAVTKSSQVLQFSQIQCWILGFIYYYIIYILLYYYYIFSHPFRAVLLCWFRPCARLISDLRTLRSSGQAGAPASRRVMVPLCSASQTVPLRVPFSMYVIPLLCWVKHLGTSRASPSFCWWVSHFQLVQQKYAISKKKERYLVLYTILSLCKYFAFQNCIFF